MPCQPLLTRWLPRGPVRPLFGSTQSVRTIPRESGFASALLNSPVVGPSDRPGRRLLRTDRRTRLAGRAESKPLPLHRLAPPAESSLKSPLFRVLRSRRLPAKPLKKVKISGDERDLGTTKAPEFDLGPPSRLELASP